MANRFILPASMREILNKRNAIPDHIRCNLTWKDETRLLFHPRLFGDQIDWDLWDNTIFWLELAGFHGELEHKYQGLILMIMPKPSESGNRRGRKSRK